MVGWVVINVFIPRINIDYIESSYMLFAIGPAVLAQMIIRPALRTSSHGPTTTPGTGFAPVAALNRMKPPKPLNIAGGGIGGAGGGGGIAVAPELSVKAAPSRVQTTLFAAAELANFPLMRVLSDEAGFAAFLQFSKLEFSAENALFLKAVDEYRTDATIETALRIYRTFISSAAPLQINLSYEESHRVVQALSPHLSDSERLVIKPARAGAFGMGQNTPRTDANAVAPIQIVVDTQRAKAAATGTGNSTDSPQLAAAALTDRAGPSAGVSGGGGGGGGGGLVSARTDSKFAPTRSPTGSGGGGGATTGTSGTSGMSARPSRSVRSLATVFDGAAKEIFLMLESDVFGRFKHTALGRSVEALWTQPQTTPAPDGGAGSGGTPSFGPTAVLRPPHTPLLAGAAPSAPSATPSLAPVMTSIPITAQSQPRPSTTGGGGGGGGGYSGRKQSATNNAVAPPSPQPQTSLPGTVGAADAAPPSVASAS